MGVHFRTGWKEGEQETRFQRGPRESECAGNGDKNQETTVLACLMSSFSVWRPGTQCEN